MFIEIKTTIRNSKFLNKVVYTVNAVLIKNSVFQYTTKSDFKLFVEEKMAQNSQGILFFFSF